MTTKLAGDKEDHCTLWPDLWWGECCAVHDASAPEEELPWLQQNWFLASCVWASSFSPKNSDKLWKIIWGRYVAPAAMFVGTSTIGWLWRIRALRREENVQLRKNS